jgi:hypothetical protein
MKKEEKYPVLIYRNETFENETRAGIEKTVEALVKLIDIWDGLDLGPCGDLWALVTNASAYYTKVFQENVEVPAEIGRYQLNKSAFLSVIDIPVPNNLYVQAKAVLKSPAYGYRDIWSLQDGKIIQDESQAEAVIHSQNIYAYNEHQKELGEAAIEYVRLSNYLDKQFTEIPWQYLPALPFSLVGRHFPNLAMLTLEVEQLRLIMSNIQE